MLLPWNAGLSVLFIDCNDFKCVTSSLFQRHEGLFLLHVIFGQVAPELVILV